MHGAIIHILEWNGFNRLLSFQHLAEVSCIKKEWDVWNDWRRRSNAVEVVLLGGWSEWDWKQKCRKGSGKMPMIKSDYFKILAKVSPTHKKSKTGSSSFSFSCTNQSLFLGPRGPGPGAALLRENRVTRNFRSYACYSPTGTPLYLYSTPQTISDILAGGEW